MQFWVKNQNILANRKCIHVWALKTVPQNCSSIFLSRTFANPYWCLVWWPREKLVRGWNLCWAMPSLEFSQTLGQDTTEEFEAARKRSDGWNPWRKNPILTCLIVKVSGSWDIFSRNFFDHGGTFYRDWHRQSTVEHLNNSTSTVNPCEVGQIRKEAL